MDQLLDLLRTIESLPDIKLCEDEYLSRETLHVLEAASLAETVLITPNGHCDWYAMDTLRREGYDVYCIERDSFGWLIGGIVTRVGVLVYG
jgi:hypothetical protein